MTVRTLGIFVAFAVPPLAAASAQADVRGLLPGAPVRLEVFGRGPWQSGRYVGLDATRLVLDRNGSQVAFDLADVTTLQTKTRSGRGAKIGAVIGTGTALVLTALIADAPRASDVVFVSSIGGLVGAAWGSGQKTREAGGFGLFLGAAIGFFATESGGCAPNVTTGNCYKSLSAAFVGTLGLMVGTGIGFLLPNWVSLPLDGLRIGASRPGDPRFTISWSLGL